ncbi:hypothetical protein ACO0QE_001824 [Hanseniaspora vineae]
MSSKQINFLIDWDVVAENGKSILEPDTDSPSKRTRRSRRLHQEERSELKKLVSKKSGFDLKIGDCVTISDKNGNCLFVLICDIRVDVLNKIAEVIGCEFQNRENEVAKQEKLENSDQKVESGQELVLTTDFFLLDSTVDYKSITVLDVTGKPQTPIKNENSSNETDSTPIYIKYFEKNGFLIRCNLETFVEKIRDIAKQGEPVPLNEMFYKMFSKVTNKEEKEAIEPNKKSSNKNQSARSDSPVKIENCDSSNQKLLEGNSFKKSRESVDTGVKNTKRILSEVSLKHNSSEDDIATDGENASADAASSDDYAAGHSASSSDLSDDEQGDSDVSDDYTEDSKSKRGKSVLKKYKVTKEDYDDILKVYNAKRNKGKPSASSRSKSKIKLNDAIKKYSRKHVGCGKKSHTPFSKRFRNINAIPDLSNISDFHQLKVRQTRTSLNQRFTSPRKKKIKTDEDDANEDGVEYGVETIYSKLKNTLVSRALNAEQKQERIRDMIYEDNEIEDAIPGREDEYSRLFLSVYSSLESEQGTSIYVSGTPGVGKTLTIRQVIKDLYEPSLAEDGELPLFQYIEMNGLKFISSSDCYEVLWQNISGETLTTNAALQSLEYYFNDVPKNKKRSMIVLLDEMDTLVNKKDQDVMYNFFNWPTYKNSKLIVIAVGNTMDLPERCLSNKVASRLGLTRVQFTGYTYVQLQRIIGLRLKYINNCWFYVDQENGKAILSTHKDVRNFLAQQGMHSKKKFKKVKLAITDNAIEIVSRKIASISGDARTALKICSRGIEIAEQEYLNKHGYDIYKLEAHQDTPKKNGAINTKVFDDDDDDDDADNDQEDVDKNVAEEVYHIDIKHVLRATNETNNSPILEYINNLSFAGKLILYAFISLKERNGSEEQQLGDVVDQVKTLIDLNSGTVNSGSKSSKNKYMDDIGKLLYVVEDGKPELRIADWEYLVNELIDSDILVRNNILNERVQLYRLNMSFEELKKCLKLF